MLAAATDAQDRSALISVTTVGTSTARPASSTAVRGTISTDSTQITETPVGSTTAADDGHVTPDAVEVEHGELVDATGEPGADGSGEATPDTNSVTEPAKVMRIGSMVKQLLEEVRQAPLDEASRERDRGPRR